MFLFDFFAGQKSNPKLKSALKTPSSQRLNIKKKRVRWRKNSVAVMFDNVEQPILVTKLKKFSFPTDTPIEVFLKAKTKLIKVSRKKYRKSPYKSKVASPKKTVGARKKK